MTIIDKIFDWVNTVNNIRQTGKSLYELDPQGVVKHWTKSVPGVYIIGKTAQTVGTKAGAIFNQATKAGVAATKATQKAAAGIQKASAWWLTPLKKPIMTAEATVSKVGLKSAATGTGIAIATVLGEHAASKWIHNNKYLSTIDRFKALGNKEFAIERLKQIDPSQSKGITKALQTIHLPDKLWTLLIRLRHGLSKDDIKANNIRKEGFNK